MSIRNAIAALATASVVVVGGPALAGPKDSKDECLEAHGRGQDLREKGQLSRARQAFMSCAQSVCPSVVQADCARMSEELAQLVPTVTFIARDVSAVDLPATSVYVDDVLLATRLDDGRTYELDPGKHTIRYVHDGRETTIKVVLNQGEKGRALIATFPSPTPLPAPSSAPETFAPVIEQRRSSVPLWFAGVGAAAVVTGAVIAGIGMGQVPANCSVSTNECAAPANDPSLEEASSGVSLANKGIAIGAAGVAVLVGGLVWYLAQPTRAEEPRRGQLRTPFRYGARRPLQIIF
jgi:hypothetical protein